MIILYIFNIMFITQVISWKISIRYQHYTCGGAAGQRFPNATIKLMTIKLMNMSKIGCVIACKNTNGCVSVNYNNNSVQCELNTIFMPRNVTNCTAETGWRVCDMGLKTGAVAWQSSTFEGLDANRALDGNINTILDGTYRSCTHSGGGSSYWAMEFADAATVRRVVIYFRSNGCCPERYANLYLLVSQTRADVINDVGTQCAFYAGPPADRTVPVTIKCDAAIDGKFLNIKSSVGALSLCEVFVYSD